MIDFTGHGALVLLLLALIARPLSRLWPAFLVYRRTLGVGAFVLSVAHVAHMVTMGWTLAALPFLLPTLQVGGWTGIVGPNGAGKTTLLQVATGSLAPQAGSVTSRGLALYVAQRTDDPPEMWSGFQGLRQAPSWSELVTPGMPNSGVLLLPTRTTPASR